VALAQLTKLSDLNRQRQELSGLLSRSLSGCEHLVMPPVRQGCTHVYYLYALKVRCRVLGLPRALLLEALRAEGIPVQGGYVKPLYRLPIFRVSREQWASFPSPSTRRSS
jgi:dTDP-4-amino-4,6-dideoxygalactose transaminase